MVVVIWVFVFIFVNFIFFYFNVFEVFGRFLMSVDMIRCGGCGVTQYFGVFFWARFLQFVEGYLR